MASPPYKVTKLSEPSGSPPSQRLSLGMSSTSTSPASSSIAPNGRKRLGLTSGLESTGVKKLTLKPKARPSAVQASATPPASSQEFINNAVLTLTRSIRAIQSRPPAPTPESLQSLYQLCEAAVSRGAAVAQQLYDRIRMEVERGAGDVRRALASEDDEDAQAWVVKVEREWKGWEERMLLIRSIFERLDRGFVLQSTGLLSIWDLSQDVFRHSVIENEEISKNLTAALLSMVNSERTGTQIPRQLLHSLLLHLRALSTSSYTQIFTLPFLAASRVFFHNEGLTLSATLPPSDYLSSVERRLQDEGERCDNVLGGGDLKGSMGRVVLEEMVTGHIEKIAENDLSAMMRADSRDTLRSLYSLLGRVGAAGVLKKSLHEYIKAAGIDIVMDTANDASMISNLIAFRTRSQDIVNDAFGGDPALHQSVGQAFEVFVNKRENKPAEMMAKFLDAKLRSGNKAMNDDDLESVLKDVLYLFRFTQGKDIFEAFYKRDLAKRLLLNKSASFDAERSMLNKLKDECGPGFTSSLEIMFKDIELSSDVLRSYLTTPAYTSTPHPFSLTVNVLSTGNWPTYPALPFLLPPSVAKELTLFEGFYTSKHSGRNVTWRHALDTVQLKGTFPKGGKKELSVSAYQAGVLLMFNEVGDGGKLGFDEIQEGTKIETVELKRTLQSLACGKVRVLVKSPRGKDVDEGDQFAFNTEFKDDHIKIKINQIQQKETAEENKSTTERVFTDRSSHLQLAIVRIMKARKTLKYSELTMEVISQIGTRFKVQTSEIKKSIDSLITLEYLRRADGQPGVFEYLA